MMARPTDSNDQREPVPLPETAYLSPIPPVTWDVLFSPPCNVTREEIVATPRGFVLPEGVTLAWDATEVTRRTNDGSVVLPGRWVVTQEFDRGLASELVEHGCFSSLAEALVCCRVTIERTRARRAAAAACG